MEPEHVSEAQVLDDMFVTMVHQMPDRVVTIASKEVFMSAEGNAYDKHQLRFRIRGDVVEAFCFTCEELRKTQGT